jgi:hypothetical protein
MIAAICCVTRYLLPVVMSHDTCRLWLCHVIPATCCNVTRYLPPAIMLSSILLPAGMSHDTSYLARYCIWYLLSTAMSADTSYLLLRHMIPEILCQLTWPDTGRHVRHLLPAAISLDTCYLLYYPAALPRAVLKMWGTRWWDSANFARNTGRF